MKELNNNIIIISLLTITIILTMLINTGELEEYQKLYPPIEQNSVATQITKNLRVDETNAGPMDFDAAENYCKMKGMTLPTREQAWEMWLASSNCKIAMVLNKEIIRDKAAFFATCNNPNLECTVKAEKTTYQCNQDANLLFLDEKSYRYGNYWLKDKFDKNRHYSANFINGTTNVYNDAIKLLGVRCVSSRI